MNITIFFKFGLRCNEQLRFLNSMLTDFSTDYFKKENKFGEKLLPPLEGRLGGPLILPLEAKRTIIVLINFFHHFQAFK